MDDLTDPIANMVRGAQYLQDRLPEWFDKNYSVWVDSSNQARRAKENNMSAWTDEKHDAARKWVNAEGERDTWVEDRGDKFLADALDEIERLRALTTVTDGMVERLAIYQNDAHLTTWGFPWRRLSEEDKKAARAEARWALEAAFNPKEDA